MSTVPFHEGPDGTSPEPPPATLGSSGAAMTGSIIDCATGTYDYFFNSPTFIWSDQMYRIHGYERGEIVPTLEVGMSHVHAAERKEARAIWDRLITEAGPVTWYFTLVDIKGRQRRVLSVADRLTRDGIVIGVRGYLSDITASVHEDSYRRADDAVARSAERRAVIEQAKGVLMAVRAMSTDEAFLTISRHSQNNNQKVTEVAQSLLDASSSSATLDALVTKICSRSPHS